MRAQTLEAALRRVEKELQQLHLAFIRKQSEIDEDAILSLSPVIAALGSVRAGVELDIEKIDKERGRPVVTSMGRAYASAPEEDPLDGRD